RNQRRQRRQRPPGAVQDGPRVLPHAYPAVAAALRVDPARGLTAAEAARRLAHFGPNALPAAPPPGLGALVLRQFQSPLVLALAIAAAVSALIGDAKDAAMIAAVLVADAAIGAVQEHRAQRALSALRAMSPPRA